MQGSAAQSTEILSEQRANTHTRNIEPSTVTDSNTESTQAPAVTKPVAVRPSAEEKKRPSPIRTTGQGSGQSSVTSPSPAKLEKEQQTQQRPWEQQSARDTRDKGASVKSTTSKKPSEPWQQQSAVQKTSDSEAQERESTSSEATPARLRRVIIDPVTGLYVETGLDGSARPSNENTTMSFENRQEDLLEWPFWEMEGRIGISVDKNSYNGSLAWQQDAEAIDFRFRGPLGFGGVRIHGDLDEQVRVKTTTGEDFTVTDFETEMQAKMGWGLPINSLRYWVLGIVDPNKDADVILNEQDLLDELIQDEWKVVYERYKEVDGVDLPSKFKITGADTKIRMLVNEWTIPASE